MIRRSILHIGQAIDIVMTGLRAGHFSAEMKTDSNQNHPIDHPHFLSSDIFL